jgi:hypothetical protein
MKTNPNAAARRIVITMRVESIDLDRNVCFYRNYHEQNGKVWQFRASLQVDRDLIRMLEPGKGYSVVQTVDDFNTTHWTHCLPYNGKIRFDADQIVIANSKKKAERKVNQDMLDQALGSFDF